MKWPIGIGLETGLHSLVVQVSAILQLLCQFRVLRRDVVVLPWIILDVEQLSLCIKAILVRAHANLVTFDGIEEPRLPILRIAQ